MADLLCVREKFLAHPQTVKNIRQDFQAWRKGRLHYAFWAIDVDVPAVRAQISAANQHLAPFLLAAYQRQPHITLGICGFLSDQQQYVDDYAASSLQAHVAALKSLALQPFNIEVGRLASFASAPFLHVKDDGNQLYQLHQCLHALDTDLNFQYVPHVTVGLYADAWSTALVSDVIDAFPLHLVTHHQIRKISLMRYVAAEIGGALTKIADYDLARAEMTWHEPPPFAVDYRKA